MRLINFLPAPLLLLTAISGACQSRSYVYYFDKDLNPPAKEIAAFRGQGSYQEGIFEFSLFDAGTSSLVLKEHYTDSSLQHGEGLSETFYGFGKVMKSGMIHENEHHGLWITYDSSGRVSDSSIYQQGKLLSQTHLGHYRNGKLDSLVRYDYSNDRLEKFYYNEDGFLLSHTNFVGEDGYLETWQNDGTPVMSDSVHSRLEIEASFPGGQAAWTKYIVNQLQRNADRIIKSGEFGTCIVKFIVDKTGKVTSAEATSMQGSVLAAVAVKIILHSPTWNPASQYGRRVNAYRLQPVTLMDPN